MSCTSRPDHGRRASCSSGVLLALLGSLGLRWSRLSAPTSRSGSTRPSTWRLLRASLDARASALESPSSWPASLIARGGIGWARLGALLALVAGIWLVAGPFLHGIWSSESQVDRRARTGSVRLLLDRLVRRRRRRRPRPRVLRARASRQAAVRRLGSRRGADVLAQPEPLVTEPVPRRRAGVPRRPRDERRRPGAGCGDGAERLVGEAARVD